MKEGSDPRAVELTALCRSGGSLRGEWPQAGMARLADSLAVVDTEPPPVAWSATGRLRRVAGGEAEVWLHLTCGEYFLMTRDTVTREVLACDPLPGVAP